jgi:hypothetical protein
MSHPIPDYEAGAVRVTRARYSRALPEDLDRPRTKLAACPGDAREGGQ